MKVLWITNIPSPYRVKFFNELGKKCDLTVLFEKKASDERDSSWKDFTSDHFNAVFLQGKSIGVAEAFCPSVVKHINKAYDHIVVTNYSDLTGMLAIMYMKCRRIPYEIEGDGAFPGNGKGFKEYIKRFFISRADKCFSTAGLHDEYYRTYGARQEFIFRYPFTSISDDEVLSEPPSKQAKEIIRRQLGIPEKYVILSVGQFIHRKGFDILIRSASCFSNDYGFYIVGGEPTEEYIQLKNELGVSNVHFVGFKKPDELNQYYRAADLFVLPTREDIWGLVINEAMAHGLPVITTDRCIAGLELIDDKGGALVPVDDADTLTEAISRITRSDMTAMGKVNLSVMKEYTIEKMAKEHIAIWNNELQKD